MDVTITPDLVNAIVKAYNKENPAKNITVSDIKSMTLDNCVIRVNNLLVSWESVKLS